MIRTHGVDYIRSLVAVVGRLEGDLQPIPFMFVVEFYMVMKAINTHHAANILRGAGFTKVRNRVTIHSVRMSMELYKKEPVFVYKYEDKDMGLTTHIVLTENNDGGTALAYCITKDKIFFGLRNAFNQHCRDASDDDVMQLALGVTNGDYKQLNIHPRNRFRGNYIRPWVRAVTNYIFDK